MAQKCAIAGDLFVGQPAALALGLAMGHHGSLMDSSMVCDCSPGGAGWWSASAGSSTTQSPFTYSVERAVRTLTPNAVVIRWYSASANPSEPGWTSTGLMASGRRGARF
jgi:hypothetical protein